MTDESQQILAEVASLIDSDPLAYRAVIEALRRRADASGGDGDLDDRVAAALSAAADVPMRLIELAVPVAGLAAALAADGNQALRGDVITASLLAHAAARSAAALVAINLAGAAGDPRAAQAADLLAGLAPPPR
jgi:formiminotetrahydrofolate cyclodeaminase